MDEQEEQFQLIGLDRVNDTIAQSKEDALEILGHVISVRCYQPRFLIDHENRGSIGWHFFLPPEFREPLDIKYLKKEKREKSEENDEEGVKKVKVVTWMEWLQGSTFAFDRGHMIYDTEYAYTLPWADALKRINICLQVSNATPVVPEEKKLTLPKLTRQRRCCKRTVRKRCMPHWD